MNDHVDISGEVKSLVFKVFAKVNFIKSFGFCCDKCQFSNVSLISFYGTLLGSVRVRRDNDYR